MKRKLTAAACILAASIAGAALFGGCAMKGGMVPDNNGGQWFGGISFDNAGTIGGSGANDPAAPDNAGGNSGSSESDKNENYAYENIFEQGFTNAALEASSYFSLDRNTANYSLVRAQLNSGSKIASKSVRVEELINYFSYGYPAPVAGEGFKATAYLSNCPWQAGNRLLTVGMRTEEVVVEAEKNNYVFLIDVSGSMSSRVDGLEGQTCLSLAKYGISKLVDGLGDNDSVSVVTYASGVDTVLDPTMATSSGKAKIMNAVNGLRAYGSTNASGGLELAYRNASKNFTQNGNNRIVLISDGDFNVGITDATELKEFIQEKANGGVYLSVLGVGMGNLRDDFMQTLALNGNGNYAYIDTPAEAEKVLCDELQGMLTVVAKDAKAKVEFNRDAVEKYRLIGYDMKRLTQEEYENSKTDAGEIGSNLCVTAVYEITLKEDAEAGARIADVSVRYKTPDAQEEREVNCSVSNALTSSEDAAFISCVAEFGLILRSSQYKGNATLKAVEARLADLPSYLEADAYKKEFKGLVAKAIASGYYGE